MKWKAKAVSFAILALFVLLGASGCSQSSGPTGAASPQRAATEPTAVTPASTPKPKPSNGSPTLSQPQANNIAEAFASGDTARIATQLVSAVRRKYQTAPGPVLPTGATLTISASDVRITAPNRAVGLVHLGRPGHVQRWVLNLVLEQGEWRVLQLQPMPAL
jgi:hypothetical protein